MPVPLVLHGSSGVADDELGRAVAHGIVKINVGTILNVAFTHAVRTRLADDETIVDPAQVPLACPRGDRRRGRQAGRRTATVTLAATVSRWTAWP